MKNFKFNLNDIINYINSKLGQRGKSLLFSASLLAVLFYIYYNYIPERENLDSLGIFGIDGKYVYYAFATISFFVFLYTLVHLVGIGHSDKMLAIEPSSTSQVFKITIAIVLFILFSYIIYAISNNSEFITFDNLWLFLGITFGISLLYTIYRDMYGLKGLIISDADDSYISIIKNLIFYIPCLIVDLIDTIQKEYNITPRTSYILLLIEAIIISLYFYGEFLGNFFLELVTHTSNNLVKDPIRLNNKHVIGSYPKINPKKSYDEYNDQEDKQDYNYALSAWVYINPQYGFDDYKTILDYGNKPLIEYKGQSNSLRIKIKSGVNNEHIVYETKEFKLQKWNNFIINVHSNQVDIHLNNEIIVSEKYDLSTWNLHQSITVGDENGLEGAVCNVNYFNEPISKLTMSFIYSLFKDKNPPVI